MAQVRARFRELLEFAAEELQSAKSDRDRFHEECRRCFEPVWNAIDEIKEEVVAKGLGDVTSANVTPSSDRFEIIYNFKRADHSSVSMKFRFLNFTGPTAVTVMMGQTWADERDAKQFRADCVSDVVDYVLINAAAFFRTEKLD